VTAFIYLAGFLIGAAVFLYLFSLYNQGMDKLKSMGDAGAARPESSENPESLETKNFRRLPARAPGVRLCPLCGSELTKYEALYASKNYIGGEAKLLIHGCRYCYKSDEVSDAARKSDI
jgi:hypothetical protein